MVMKSWDIARFILLGCNAGMWVKNRLHTPDNCSSSFKDGMS